MTPQQFAQYQDALHFDTRHIGYFLNIGAYESKEIIPAMRRGEIPIEDWLQEELMHWLSVYRQEYQKVMALYQEGKHYVYLPANIIKDRDFYESFNYYRPDIEPDKEIGRWVDLQPINLATHKRHLASLQGSMLLIEFSDEAIAKVCLGSDRFALFEWLGGYNNFVQFVAGELQAQRIPYRRLDYRCPINLMAEVNRTHTEFVTYLDENEGEVVSMFPGTETDAYATEKLPLERESNHGQHTQNYMANKQEQAAALAHMFDGLL